MADLERIYVVPFWQAYEGVRTRRSKKAVSVLRSFISRHMKAEDENISISEAVNSAIWKRGIQKPPRKIKIKAVKRGEKVNVMLLDEKAKEPAAKEEKKDEKVKPEEAKPAEKKPEAAPAPKEAAAKEEKKEPEKPKAEEKKEAPKKE